jgi:hypothetical protein
MGIGSAIILTAMLILGFRRLDRWEKWECRNRKASWMLFGGLNFQQRLIKRLLSEPPDRHGDLWN